MWLISNNFFLSQRHDGSPVEWAYAFDVHLNALFPLLIILHGIQLLLFGGKELSVLIQVLFHLYVVLDQPYFLSLFLSNSLWLVAFFYYIYITFLGYSSKLTCYWYFFCNSVSFLALPGMQRTVLILYASIPVVVVYLLSLIFSWNFATALKHFYQMRL